MLKQDGQAEHDEGKTSDQFGDFAEALANYQRDPELRERHGEAGLGFAKTMDWDEINAAVMGVYERVIERRRRA